MSQSIEQPVGGESPPPPTNRRGLAIAAGAAVLLVATALGVWLLLPKPSAPPAAPAWQQEAIGASVQGKPIVAYRFGKGERRVLILGGVHGDEFGADAAEQLIQRLKDSPESVPEGVEISVIPVVNPDGREALTRGNSQGVDINRNMPSKNWASKLNKKDSSGKRGLQGGAAPGSEPESQAVMGYLDRGFAAVVSLHSKGGIIDFDGPGGEALAQRVAEKAGLPVEHVAYQPYVTGSMGLFVPEKYTVPVITVELESPDLSPQMEQAILLPAMQ